MLILVSIVLQNLSEVSSKKSNPFQIIVCEAMQKNILFAKIRVAKKMSTRQAGNPFLFLIFRLHMQTKFSKEQNK